eukprot:scaffold13973_cov43-Cyclotella_meneghiniana.AAC.3
MLMLLLPLPYLLYFRIVPPAFGCIASLVAFSLIHEIDGQPSAAASSFHQRGLQNDTSHIISPHNDISPEAQSPVFPSADSNTLESNSTCIDTPNWKDSYDNGCDWYEEFDGRCSQFSTWYNGTMGAANDNCCHCGRGSQIMNNDLSINFTLANSSAPSPSSSTISGDTLSLDTFLPTTSCYDTYNWKDSEGYGCEWYTENEAPECPEYGWSYEGIMGVAQDNCCHCKGGSETPPTLDSSLLNSTISGTDSPTSTLPSVDSSLSSSCHDTPGWTDAYGESCEWYEIYEVQGCPKYGHSDGGIMGVAQDNCCHCGGGGKCLADLRDPSSSSSSSSTTCQDTPCWYDGEGYDCRWYEVMDDPGCPRYGDRGPGDMGTAHDNCCYCKNVTDDTFVSES